MTNRHINVSYGRTVPLADFASAKLQASAGGDLEPGEDKDLAYKALWDEVKAQVLPRIKKLRGVKE